MVGFHRPELLSAGHGRAGFNSGEPELDEWLRRYAGQNRRRDTAAIWVITDPGGEIACFASLSMTGADKSAGTPELGDRAPNPVPALLIGRLATNRRCAGLGLATGMVGHLLATDIDAWFAELDRFADVPLLEDGRNQPPPPTGDELFE